MTTLTEGIHTGEFLLSEGNGSISREEVVIDAAAPAMVSGTVLGKITASGKYAPYSNANTDGTEVAAAILYTPVADSTADQKAVVISYHAEVASARLTGLDTAARADLAALFIKVRD